MNNKRTVFCPIEGCDKSVKFQGLGSHLRLGHKLDSEQAREIIEQVKEDDTMTAPTIVEKDRDELILENLDKLRALNNRKKQLIQMKKEGLTPPSVLKALVREVRELEQNIVDDLVELDVLDTEELNPSNEDWSWLPNIFGDEKRHWWAQFE